MRPLILPYAEENFRQAEALLDRSERFFSFDTLGRAAHQTPLAAHDKLLPSNVKQRHTYCLCALQTLAYIGLKDA